MLVGFIGIRSYPGRCSVPSLDVTSPGEHVRTDVNHA